MCVRLLLGILILVPWLVLTGQPLFGAQGLLEQCLDRAPAGIALQDHLAKARSGNVESMWCAGAIKLYVSKEYREAIPLLERPPTPATCGPRWSWGFSMNKEPG